MSAQTDIDTMISNAQNYAANALGAGVGAMNNAIGVLDSLSQGSLVTGFPQINIAVPQPISPDAVPTYTGTHFTPDAFGGVAPAIQSLPSLNFPNDPGSAPGIASYIEPQIPIGGEPDPSIIGTLPVLNTDFAAPTAPDLQGQLAGITLPVLIDVVIPDAPTFSLPDFNGVRPDFNTPMPTGLDVKMRTEYSNIAPVFRAALDSQLDSFLDREFPQFRTAMDAIETRLKTYLDGGSAIAPGIEQAMYNRTLDKTNAEARKAAQEVLGKATRAGHTLFSPSIASQLQDIDQSRRDNNSRAAVEIAVKLYELEQNNLQFAVKASSEMRKMAVDAGMQYYGHLVSLNGQALEYARSVVDQIVKAYDIAMKTAELQARLYEADADIYKARLQGALAVVQFYEAQIRAELAKVQVNQELVMVYKARIEAVQAEANVYESQVKAVVELAGLEKLKVELFDAKVQAYGHEVNAYTARWQGYEAAVRGQAAKVQASAEQVRAFQAQVQAYSEKVRAVVAQIEAVAKTNEANVGVYKAQVDAFATLERAKVDAVRLDVDQFDAQLKGFIAKTQAQESFSKAQVASYEVHLRGLIETVHIYLEQMREQHKLDITRVTGIAQVSQTIGQEFGRMAQAALAGMNTLASSGVTSTAS